MAECNWDDTMENYNELYVYVSHMHVFASPMHIRLFLI